MLLANAPLEVFSERINSIEISSTSAMVNAAARLKREGVDIVDLAPGEPHFPTPSHIKDAGIRAIHNNFTKYTAVAGLADLREAICDRHRQDFGSDYRWEEVIATPGGKYALFATLQVLVSAGDEVVIPVPYWVSFKDMVRFAGGKCVFLDTAPSDFVLTAEMVERVLTSKTRVIILNYPNNPSGALLDSHELEMIIDIAEKRNIWVILDECYLYLTYSGSRVSAGQFKPRRPNIVIAGSVSKTYAMTGWRLGYAMAPAAVTAALQKLQSQEVSCPSSVTQAAALAALTGPQDCIEEMRLEYLRMRDRAMAELTTAPGMRVVLPGGGFFVFPEISELLLRRNMKTAREFTTALLQKTGVLTVSGEGFGLSNYMRISFSVSEVQLSRGMAKLREFLAA
jgi:aspartate aminotransferase